MSEVIGVLVFGGMLIVVAYWYYKSKERDEEMKEWEDKIDKWREEKNAQK